MGELRLLEVLLLAALISLAGGYGGRALAIWNERKARIMLADQFDFLSARVVSLRGLVDEQFDSVNRRLAKREGADGLQRRKRNEEGDGLVSKALEALVEKKKPRRDPDDPDDSEIEQALRVLAERDSSKGAPNGA